MRHARASLSVLVSLYTNPLNTAKNWMFALKPARANASQAHGVPCEQRPRRREFACSGLCGSLTHLGTHCTHITDSYLNKKNYWFKDNLVKHTFTFHNCQSSNKPCIQQCKDKYTHTQPAIKFTNPSLPSLLVLYSNIFNASFSWS